MAKVAASNRVGSANHTIARNVSLLPHPRGQAARGLALKQCCFSE
jgi:hypothetical protein